MRRLLFFAFSFVAAFCWGGALGLAQMGMMHTAPSADLTVSMPKDVMPSMGPVIFPHKRHKGVGCKYCHHTHTKRQAFKSCSQSGCHANSSMETGRGSFYAAFHSSGKNSCLGCHRGASNQKMRHGPVSCQGCHGDDKVVSGAEDAPQRPEQTLGESIIPPPLPMHFAEKNQVVGDDGCVITKKVPTTTFPVDIDRGVYNVVRSYLLQGLLPSPVSVTVEGLINALDLESPASGGGDAPFEIRTELAPSPWNPEHPLLHITLRSPLPDLAQRKPANIVFLIDTSSSMFETNKLPLFLAGFTHFLDRLQKDDFVSIVGMSGNSAILLPPTSGDQKQKIIDAVKTPRIRGDIPPGQGIRIAYDLGKRRYIKGGINTLVFVTDGDFGSDENVFRSLYARAREGKRQGIGLCIFEFGQLYTNNHFLWQLAAAGGGGFFHIEELGESIRAMTHGLLLPRVPLVEGVRASVTFNPETVSGYHRLGAESCSACEQQDKQAGEAQSRLYPGQFVSTLYNLVLEPGALQSKKNLCIISIKYKLPGTDLEKEIQQRVFGGSYVSDRAQTSAGFRLSAGVAEFGILLRGSDRPEGVSFGTALQFVRSAFKDAPTPLREELLYLIWKSSWLASKS